MLSASLATTVRLPTRSSKGRDESPLRVLRGAGRAGEAGLEPGKALTVESKVLGEGLSTEELKSFRHKIANSPGVLL